MGVCGARAGQRNNRALAFSRLLLRRRPGAAAGEDPASAVADAAADVGHQTGARVAAVVRAERAFPGARCLLGRIRYTTAAAAAVFPGSCGGVSAAAAAACLNGPRRQRGR